MEIVKPKITKTKEEKRETIEGLFSDSRVILELSDGEIFDARVHWGEYIKKEEGSEEMIFKSSTKCGLSLNIRDEGVKKILEEIENYKSQNDGLL